MICLKLNENLFSFNLFKNKRKRKNFFFSFRDNGRHKTRQHVVITLKDEALKWTVKS